MLLRTQRTKLETRLTYKAMDLANSLRFISCFLLQALTSLICFTAMINSLSCCKCNGRKLLLSNTLIDALVWYHRSLVCLVIQYSGISFPDISAKKYIHKQPFCVLGAVYSLITKSQKIYNTFHNLEQDWVIKV